MIVIWGWRVRFKTLMEGAFFCPTCGGDRTYARKQGRNWFTLFFIPLIPLAHTGDEFVECSTCRSAYKSSVLQHPTTAALAETLLAATREALVWVLRSAPPAPAATAAAVRALSLAANRPWTEAELAADVAGLDVNHLPNRLAMLAGMLNEHGKERFLAECTRVAAADGPVTAEERQLLENIAAALTMTPAHAYGVISQATQQAGL
jgi:zinc-ribbon family